MHYLTTVLRERSGVQADGISLVGQALGGENPKLLVNNFRTETEQNVQRGVEQILRGMYQAVRNPRSHEQMEDTQHDAEAIVCFIDYILSILRLSREAFTVDGFLESLRDAEFVESQRYAQLLVTEIPAGRRPDVLISLFGVRREFELRKLRYIIAELLSLLDDLQTSQYLTTVSNELRIAAEDGDIRSAVQMLTAELWPGVGEAARLRIETN